MREWCANHFVRRYRRDKRGDCVQVSVALVVTPAGLPLACERFPGNTADKTTLKDMLARIQKRYGSAERIWVMDRGRPTEAVLAELRQSDAKVSCLGGTPKGRLTKLEKELVDKPWQQVREHLRVKLLPQAGEVHVLAESGARIRKERGRRRRKLKALWQRLKEIQQQDLPRDQRPRASLRTKQTEPERGGSGDLCHPTRQNPSKIPPEIFSPAPVAEVGLKRLERWLQGYELSFVMSADSRLAAVYDTLITAITITLTKENI